MKAWGVTDVGLRRKENQDTYALDTLFPPEVIVAVVCDGMGGVSGGRLASGIAVETFMEELRTQAREDMTLSQLREAEAYCVHRANDAVYRRAQEDMTYHGMGTTLVSAIASPGHAVVCNVGDSRAYLIEGERIARVTRDHSVVENLIEAGDITPEQARTHPNRNLITRALGPDKTIVCDAFEVELNEGSSLLLCTDGLTAIAEDEEILAVVRAEEDGAKALEQLLALAISRGAPDNVTAVLIRNEKGVKRQNG